MQSTTDHPLTSHGYQMLHPRVRTLWLVRWAAETAVSRSLLAGLPLMAVMADRQGAVWLAAGAAALFVGNAAVQLARALLRYRSTGYRLGAETLDLAWGVWWRSVRSTPYFRVQHVDVAQGPVERMLGLSKLVIHTASAQQRMTLAGVASAEVEALRVQILANVGQHDGV